MRIFFHFFSHITNYIILSQEDFTWFVKELVYTYIQTDKKSAHDILALHVGDAARDLARMENKQIVEVAEACSEKVSGTAYSD
jgi:hypothetical protein